MIHIYIYINRYWYRKYGMYHIIIRVDTHNLHILYEIYVHI